MEVLAIEIDGNLPDDAFAALLTRASPEKIPRIVRSRRRADALKTLIADLLVRRTAGDRLGMPNRAIAFGYGPSGKPFLSGHGDFHFNISHSGDWVVGAFAPVRVGIDIEAVREMDATLALVAKRYFSGSERGALDALEGSAKADAFFGLWTLKESLLKATGEGLFRSLREACLVASPGGDYAHAGAAGAFSLRSLEAPAGYKLSLCAAGGLAGIGMRRQSLTEALPGLRALEALA